MHPWTLDPSVIHLNHGSFGACPAPVIEEQRLWQALMESNPVLFFMETLQPALNNSRLALSEFVGAETAGMAFVPNATAGINAVLRSLEPSLGPGDEILITDHAYNACRNVAEVTARRSGATLVEARVPFPLENADQFVAAVLAHVSTATRAVMVDWVTSPTAIVVPVADIVAALEPEVPVLIDAAHAPGMIPLQLQEINASYVVGNCHKWLCAPKSAGFLFVRADRRAGVMPATVSHGWNTEPPADMSRFHSLFDWTGTDDPSARLSVPKALDFMSELHDDGWAGVMETNRALARQGRDIVCDALRIELPMNDVAIGSMATIPLPSKASGSGTGDPDPLTQRLRSEWSIEVPVFSWRDWPNPLLRISAQLYNTEADYHALAAALVAALR